MTDDPNAIGCGDEDRPGHAFVVYKKTDTGSRDTRTPDFRSRFPTSGSPRLELQRYFELECSDRALSCSEEDSIYYELTQCEPSR